MKKKKNIKTTSSHAINVGHALQLGAPALSIMHISTRIIIRVGSYFVRRGRASVRGRSVCGVAKARVVFEARLFPSPWLFSVILFFNFNMYVSVVLVLMFNRGIFIERHFFGRLMQNGNGHCACRRYDIT